MAGQDDTPPDMAEVDRLVTDFVNRVSEHVDAVTVLVSKKREDGHDGTWHLHIGRGNWYTRYGQLVDFMEREKARHYSERGEDGPG